MSTYPQFVTVYRVLGWSDEVCNLGFNHKIAVYAQKALRLTDEVRINHARIRGYSDSEYSNPIYVDTQGRKYNTAMAVDFHATRNYIDPDSNYWTARKPEGIRIDQYQEQESS